MTARDGGGGGTGGTGGNGGGNGPERIRRVVTGHDARGRAVVVTDEEVEPVTLSLLPGFATIELWHTTATPSMPDDLGSPGVPDYFPAPGGTVFRVVTFPPDPRGGRGEAGTTGAGAGAAAGGAGTTGAADAGAVPVPDVAAALEEAQRKVPALMARLEPDHPGMHTTDSVDYAIVLDGELELELDDGALVPVRPGTVVVQRGTRHAWRNRTDRAARIAFVLVGARPAG